ncbi:MAG: Na+/H+ antiporter NhaC family protein [Butyricicoccaceae bacterium]
MYATFWALVPPIVAITLALLTKEVYSSLFIGILVGGLFYSGFSFEGTLNHIINEGFLSVLSDKGNVGILIFLVILGTMVCLINRAGGSAAFGQWAQTHIKSRIGVQLITVILGMIIFIDDYFNCLTVGSVMRPVADKHNISRPKLAYLIDATAAPVCIIAPISSWAAAVTGFVDGEDGLSLFISAIPYNYYALLTLVFMIGLILLNIDFGPMAQYEKSFRREDDAVADVGVATQEGKNAHNGRGSIIDLLLPILCLIICCVIGMIYTGGFFSGAGFVEAFGNSDAPVALVLGSSIAMLITLIFYQVRRVLPFKDCMGCLPEGFQAMVPAILILSFAWTLKAMTDSLGAAEYVAAVVKNYAAGFQVFLPAIIFVIAALLAFATGTSWGTFGILIPIVVAVFQQTDYTMMIISISACMAGAVCGDHCSPISDTTIMASAGAQCEHVTHVSTQMPYAIVVAVISFITYIVAGLVKNVAICLLAGLLLTAAALLVLKLTAKNKPNRN